MSHDNGRLIAGYFPVIHQGYIDLFDKYPDTPVGVFDSSITSQFDYLRKDIRALKPEHVVRLIQGLGIPAFTLSAADIKQRLKTDEEIIMIDDDISHTIADPYSDKGAPVHFESSFLRWDRRNTSGHVGVDVNRTIPASEISIDPDLIAKLYKEAERSSDWWRFVAAGIMEDDKLILTHNRAFPHEYANFSEGDPRITENRGSGIEKSLFIHAEADLIAQMAKNGVSTKGKDLFVTTFPCPNCAKLIAASGLKSCYFIEGYAMLDGQRVLNNADVEIVKIEIDTLPDQDQSRLRPYSEKS